MRSFHGFTLAAPILLLCGTSPALASLIITPTFDSSFNTLSTSDRTNAEATINSVIAAYEAEILNSISVNITFKVNQAVLGQTAFSVYQVPYSSYVSALTSHAISADDFASLANLPSTATVEPVTDLNSIYMKAPLVRALGISNFGADNTTLDATISFGTSSMNLNRTGTQDPNKYDLQSVASHEIDEALGLGSSMGLGLTYISPEDLFRYTGTTSSCANVSGRSFTSSTSAIACFSINGANGLAQFNQGSTGDYGDWASTGTIRVQDAFGTPGAQPNLGLEWRALDVVGYTTVQSTVPEPGTGVFLALAIGAAGLRRRRGGFRTAAASLPRSAARKDAEAL